VKSQESVQYLPHYAHSFLQVIKGMGGQWTPNHETLVNIALPYVTCNSDEYIDKLAKFTNLRPDSIDVMLVGNSKQFRELCRKYLDHEDDQTLLEIFENILTAEAKIEKKYGSTTFPYQLLRLGILTSDNFRQLSQTDLETFANVYGLAQQEPEEIAAQIIVQQMSILNEIKASNPKIMLWKITHCLITDASTSSIKMPDVSVPEMKMISRSLPIPIKSENSVPHYQIDVDEQHNVPVDQFVETVDQFVETVDQSNQFDDQPQRIGDQPSQFDEQPSQFDDQPQRIGDQPSQFDEQPSQFDDQLLEIDRQPDENNKLPIFSRDFVPPHLLVPRSGFSPPPRVNWHYSSSL
jgi:hypothetical protein